MEEEVIDFDQGLSYIEEGITKLKRIVEGLPEVSFTSEECMLLYSTIYNLCQPPHNYSHQLFRKYMRVFTKYITTTVIPSLEDKHGEFMLRELVIRWQNHQTMVWWLSHIFGYLNHCLVGRSYPDLEVTSYPSLKDFGLFCFTHEVYEVVKANARDIVIGLIDKEREGEQIDRVLLQEAIGMFLEIEGRINESYEQEFETVLLNHTVEYYSRKAATWISDDSCSDYLWKAEKCLQMENNINCAYSWALCLETMVELQSVC